METFTDRQERVSWWRQDALRQAHVAVIGAGALGNEVIKNLCLMGIGNLHIFDFDTVESSNLSRTVLFDKSSLGQPKAVVARDRARQLNIEQSATIRARHLDVVWELGGDYIRRMDLVLGCLDNLEARLAIGKLCYLYAIPFLDGGIRELGGRIQFHLTGSGACMDCTIGSGERSALRQRYSCLNVRKSYVPQSIVPTVQVSSAIVAAIMSQETVKVIHRRAVPFGSVISWFGETNDFDVLKLVKDPSCRTCSLPPPRPIVETGCAAGVTAAGLLAAVGADCSVVLPSAFVLGFSCSLCGREFVLRRPSHRCRDVELVCSGCDSGVFVELHTVDEISESTVGLIGDVSLSALGVGDGASLFARRGGGDCLLVLRDESIDF